MLPSVRTPSTSKRISLIFFARSMDMSQLLAVKRRFYVRSVEEAKLQDRRNRAESQRNRNGIGKTPGRQPLADAPRLATQSQVPRAKY